MPSIGRRERAVVRSTHWDSRRFVEPVLSGSSRCMSCSPELASLIHLELQKSMRNYFYSIKKMVFSIMESKRFKLLKGNEEELTWLTSCGPRWGGTMHRVKAGAWGSVSSPCPLPRSEGETGSPGTRRQVSWAPTASTRRSPAAWRPGDSLEMQMKTSSSSYSPGPRVNIARLCIFDWGI